MKISPSVWDEAWEENYENPLGALARIKENNGKCYYINDSITMAKEINGAKYVFDKEKICNLAVWEDFEEEAVRGKIFSLSFLVLRLLGLPYFSFDKQKIFSFPRDCGVLTPEQLKIALIPLSFWIMRFCRPSDFSEECQQVIAEWEEKNGTEGEEEEIESPI